MAYGMWIAFGVIFALALAAAITLMLGQREERRNPTPPGALR